jgi:5-methylcytosine-specific restriction endonuclease McrA
MDSVWDITCGRELERFDLGTVAINGTSYQVLTGHEAPPADGVRWCFWCGEILAGRNLRYCRGHMRLYYEHFEWSRASWLCWKRQDGRCANCGCEPGLLQPISSWSVGRSAAETHHIVPLKGARRDFSAFNLPWNLIGLCHDCHLEVHAAMRPAPKRPPSGYDRLVAAGQMPLMEMPV